MPLTGLDQLFSLSLVTVLLLWLFGRQRWAGMLAFVLYALQLMLLAAMTWEVDGGQAVAFSLEFALPGQTLFWSLDGLGWFFALITLGAAALVALFTADGRYPGGRQFHGVLALNVLSMLLLLSSGEMLSLFIGWELVSWSSFWLMAYRGGAAARASMRYLVYAFSGAMAVLAALAWLYVSTGSLGFDAIRALFAEAEAGRDWVLMLLLGAGFAIKMGLVPFHLWQAAAYAETPGPGAAFLGAISARMGLFALLVVLVRLLGLDRLLALPIPLTGLDARDLWTGIAAITMVVPTFIALRQTDARMLLAWHGIGQGGYMLLGILIGSSLGMAGGLLHVFNYATYQAALFLTVTAVIYRTGTSDLDRLGGLITRMPWSYVTMLVGIIGLAGLPPMNGFVSKWLIYKALLVEQMPLLFLAAVIGTLGTILSVYKLIHNIFLGQLRLEHREVREVPFVMLLPMLTLTLIVMVTGFVPGAALYLVEVAMQALPVAALDYHAGGVNTATGSLNMIWLGYAMLAAIGVGALVFFAGNRSQRVDQLDNYAGGHFLSADVRYHYSHEFYPGLVRVIGPWYRGSIAWVESGLRSLLDWLAAIAEGGFRSAHRPFAMLVVTVLALWWAVRI